MISEKYGRTYTLSVLSRRLVMTGLSYVLEDIQREKTLCLPRSWIER
jgi:hypothetical protein